MKKSKLYKELEDRIDFDAELYDLSGDDCPDPLEKHVIRYAKLKLALQWLYEYGILDDEE